MADVEIVAPFSPARPSAEAVLADAARFIKRDGKVALATVVETWGSAPVPVGGQMAISAGGDFAGSVSGGCVEGEVITAAEDVFAAAAATAAPKLLEFGVADETAWRVGLPCGGRIRVMVEPFKGASDAALVAELAEARARRNGVVVRTALKSGSRTVFRRGDANSPPEVESRFRSGLSGLVPAADGEAFDLAVVPPARAVVIGGTHIAQIFSQLAREVGYEVVVVDPRSAFATPERFPGAEVHAEWPQDVLPKLSLDPFTAVVVLAHVSHIDDEALKVAVRSPVKYVGALGSTRNHAKRVERLAEAGLTPQEIGRIKAPIGLDIGASSPAEIAVSVLAEVIAAIRGPKAKSKAPKAA